MPDRLLSVVSQFEDRNMFWAASRHGIAASRYGLFICLGGNIRYPFRGDRHGVESRMKHAYARRARREVVKRPVDDTAPRYIPNEYRWGKRVYAIAFDIDTELLEQHYPNENWRNGYEGIARVLEKHGFSRQQGSVYFGNETVDPVRCVLAVQDITATYDWFRLAIRDIRMLRIEENNDLMPAVNPQADLPLGPAPVAAE